MSKRTATLAAILLALFLIPVAAIAANGTFVDDDESVFEADIEWMVANGITFGCNPPTNDHFCPEGNVTRGQMAAFLHRFADNLVGDGTVGPEGPQGPAGADGVAGPTGADGAPGTPGIDGSDGAPGTDGTNGTDGADGSDGAPGTPGADGNDGAPGIPGTDGADGATGPQGPIGPAGTVTSPIRIPAMSFLTDVSGSGYDLSTGSIRIGGTCPIYPLSLPDGVIISEIGMVVESDGVNQYPTLNLLRRNLVIDSAGPTGGTLPDPLAEASAPEVMTPPMYVNVSGPSGTVDNANYVYWLEACNPGFGDSPGDRLYGALVEFYLP